MEDDENGYGNEEDEEEDLIDMEASGGTTAQKCEIRQPVGPTIVRRRAKTERQGVK